MEQGAPGPFLADLQTHSHTTEQQKWLPMQAMQNLQFSKSQFIADTERQPSKQSAHPGKAHNNQQS